MQNSKFFIDSEDNNKLIPLCLLSKMESAELANNYDLLKLLPNILNLFSKKECEFLVLPNLLYYLRIESLINPIVPAIFLLSERNSKEINFEEKIWPTFKTLFNMKKIPAATLFFTLKKISFLINNLDKSEFNKYCIPLMCKALDCGVLKIQEVILEEMPSILKNIDKNEFQTKIYNRLTKIFIQTKNKKLRKKIMNFFICLSDFFDSYFINNNFLDDIEKIIKSETTLNICKNALILYEKIKLKVNDKSVRSKIIPSLLLMMCNGEISEELFVKGENIINSYIQKIKEKRKEQFVQDIESDSDEKNNKNNNDNSNNSNNSEKQKVSKNNNSAINNINNIISSPLSVTRTKSTLSGNISLFECNSSEDSNFALDEKSKNKKGKNEKGKKEKNSTKINNNFNNNNLFDNLLNGNNEDNYNKNGDSSFDSTSLGKNKNKNEINLSIKKEFLSSLELKKIEKKKKLENNHTEKKLSSFNENKKNKWEEIESDDENTDGLGKYIVPKKSKEEKNNNSGKKEIKKSDKKKKWDEDDEDEEENIIDENVIFSKNENQSDLIKKNLSLSNLEKDVNDIETNKEKKLEELLILNIEEEDNINNINPINQNIIINEKKSKKENNENIIEKKETDIDKGVEKDKEKDLDKDKEKNKEGSNKKKGIKKKKKHKKKEKIEKKDNENIEEKKDDKEKNNIDKENNEGGKEKEKEEEKKVEGKKEKNNVQSQISSTKMRLNQRAANIDLDNLLADDD